MLTRVITSIVALMIFFAVIFAGVIPLLATVGLVILAMLYEVYSAVTKSVPVKVCGYVCALLLMVAFFFRQTGFGVVQALIITMLFAVFLHGKVDYRELFGVVLITIYITLFMGYIPLLRIRNGLAAMAFIFIIAWGSDTAAYFCGTFFGKHKLIPKVSPKKTVEGSAGAVVCVALLCLLYVFIVDKCGGSFGEGPIGTVEYIMAPVIGIIASALSQFGDLAASAIKRDCGIKDYGKIFPGHGGFMDRFDSVILIAPVVYYVVRYFPAIIAYLK
ncbi:MAG: phosphatidate cytidylyltransferase [Candidatus Ornithomonoglobus sp.]